MGGLSGIDKKERGSSSFIVTGKYSVREDLMQLKDQPSSLISILHLRLYLIVYGTAALEQGDLRGSAWIIVLSMTFHAPS